MVDKIKRLYPDYLIFIKRNGRLYDLSNNEVTNDNLLKRYSYVVIDDNSYEVHNKINSLNRHKPRSWEYKSLSMI